MGEPRAWIVILALILVQVFFGLHYLAAKLLLVEIAPRAWAGIRAFAAALILLGCAKIFGRRIPTDRATLGRIACYSIFGVVVNQLCFVEGLHRTTTIHASILNTAIPVATLFFAVALARERVDRRRGGALALALLGAVLVISPWAERPSNGPAASLLGDLLTLANALSYSLFLVLSKRLLGRVDALAATGLLFAFGSIPLLAWGAPALAATELTRLSARAWFLALFIVVVPTALAYGLTYWALARTESSVVALFNFLQPIVAVLLGVLLLEEPIDTGFVLGSLLIATAVTLVVRAR